MRGVSRVAVLVVAGIFAGHAGAATVGVFPSSTTVRGGAPLPATAAKAVTLETAIGEQEDAMVVVGGAKRVGVVAPATVGPLPLKVFFAHYVSVGGQRVPDALLPWDGAERPTEQPNQPIWFQVTVPQGTAPGTYSAEASVVVDGQGTTVPISVEVFPVTIPPPNQVSGNLMTAFHVAAQTYGNTVGKMAGYSKSEQFQSISPTLYAFLASYRISPNNWGYGSPQERAGYTRNARWWLDSLTNMVAQVRDGIFAAMSIPISNNRTAPGNYIAGLSPAKPEEWCPYLRNVRSFWQERGWLDSFPYLYGQDEPGLLGMRLVARQSAVLHRCWPGGKSIVTGNPSPANSFLWNGGSDDVDVWVVLASRYYGQYTNPAHSRNGVSHARDKQKLVDRVRARGKTVWTYTYPNTRTPGFTATEPLSNSRMLFLWSALENIHGVLYGMGTTTYRGDPFSSLPDAGAHVLVYPGVSSPVPSARLENIRDGIEDWAIYDVVRRKRGAAQVRRLLGSLYSTDARGVRLGCTIGCPIKTTTPFSWPTWSQDASTPGKMDAAKLAALKAAS